MTGKPSRLRWSLLFLGVGLAAAGMATAFLAGTPTLHKVGIGVFAAGALVYVLARFLMIREDRFR